MAVFGHANSPLTVASAASTVIDRAYADGLGDEETSAMLKLYQALLGPASPSAS